MVRWTEQCCGVHTGFFSISGSTRYEKIALGLVLFRMARADGRLKGSLRGRALVYGFRSSKV